jgi:hypothetical protein
MAGLIVLQKVQKGRISSIGDGHETACMRAADNSCFTALISTGTTNEELKSR